MFAASANQVADNAANAAQNFYDTHEHIIAYNCCYYPPFSLDWSFTYDGLINGKGATKTFYQKLDEELSLRLQHRHKQGLFQRLRNLNSLCTEQIGDDTLYRNQVKMTALCWTRRGYQSSTLVHQIWKHWQSLPQNINLVENIPTTLPKDWRNLPNINNNIIKACPFCQQMPRIKNPIGNLEHLHQYCSSNVLQRARIHCHQRIEHALHNIYNCASINEYGRELHEEIRYTHLQEHLISAAKEAELQMRPIVRDSRLLYKQRNQNQAIKSQNEVQILVLL